MQLKLYIIFFLYRSYAQQIIMTAPTAVCQNSAKKFSQCLPMFSDVMGHLLGGIQYGVLGYCV